MRTDQANHGRNGLMPRADAKADAYNQLFLTPHTLTDCHHSQFSKFPASSLFLFCATTNKSDFRQIAETSPNLPWILLRAATGEGLQD
jgi:hypothetical protein